MVSSDSHKTNSHYYFFMKVGNANCFLPHSQQLGGLWVGYDGDPIPTIEDRLVVKGNEQADLRYLTFVSQSHVRDQVRVVSFGKDNLQIFQITGPLQYLGKNNGLDWSDPNIYKTFPASWKESVEKTLDGIGSKKFIDKMFGDSGWKLLPAKLLASIPRSSLVAPIDSLSVWQSFNRRTFQPMFALKGNTAYSYLEWLNSVPSLSPMKVGNNELLQEGLFGKLVRLYLDARLENSNTHFDKLSLNELTKTVFAMLNPAQVETIGLHICNDIRFTADVGMGKGLDVADVKGTVRHLIQANRELRIREAISKLESAGVNFSEKLRTSIEATSTIRFQCKARQTNSDEDLGTVLLIEPGAINTKKKDTLFLESLAKTDAHSFPMFHGWLDVLRFDLSTALSN